MLTAASSWRECTGCFCLASPFNLAFTWATEITLHLNNCPVKYARNVASSESRHSSISAYPFRRIAVRSLRIDNGPGIPAPSSALSICERIKESPKRRDATERVPMVSYWSPGCSRAINRYANVFLHPDLLNGFGGARVPERQKMWTVRLLARPHEGRWESTLH